MASAPFSYVLDQDVCDEPSFQDLVDYWHVKRAGRDLPLRSEIDPLELKSHMGSLIIIECLPDLTDFRFRLIGTNITSAFGRDSTGKTVRDLYLAADPEYCEFVLRAYRDVVTKKSIGRFQTSLRAVHRDYRLQDSLLLPLAASDGSATQILNKVLFR